MRGLRKGMQVEVWSCINFDGIHTEFCLRVTDKRKSVLAESLSDDVFII